MIIVLEGPDGTGKTTLASKIAERTKGALIHCTYNKDWNMELYHEDVMEAAEQLSSYGVVIIDRWAISEYVYGKAFRNGPSYMTDILVDEYKDKITWVYCRNDNAIDNHKRNAQIRTEMFDSMDKVVGLYETYINRSKMLWHVWDFDKTNQEEFFKEIGV